MLLRMQQGKAQTCQGFAAPGWDCKRKNSRIFHCTCGAMGRNVASYAINFMLWFFESQIVLKPFYQLVPWALRPGCASFSPLGVFEIGTVCTVCINQATEKKPYQQALLKIAAVFTVKPVINISAGRQFAQNSFVQIYEKTTYFKYKIVRNIFFNF